MNNFSKRMLKTYVEFTSETMEKIKNAISNERGSNPIIGIIFVAILILAVLATDSTIQGAFTSSATKFSTWLSSKLDTLMS